MTLTRVFTNKLSVRVRVSVSVSVSVSMSGWPLDTIVVIHIVCVYINIYGHTQTRSVLVKRIEQTHMDTHKHAEF